MTNLKTICECGHSWNNHNMCCTCERFVKKVKKKKEKITEIKIIGYDKSGKAYNLSKCMTDDTDQSLSQDIANYLSALER